MHGRIIYIHITGKSCYEKNLVGFRVKKFINFMRNLKLITSFGLQIKEFPLKFYEMNNEHI